MTLFIMQSSETSHHFLPLRTKYSSQHPVLNTLNVYSSLSVRDRDHVLQLENRILHVHI
jgi:hypothetical protein